MAVFKDCHQTSPKVLLKWSLSSKIVIKDCWKFCWSDSCLKRLSSKTAESSAEVIAVLKGCWSKTAESSAEMMAVFKDCRWKTAESSAEMMAVFKDCRWKTAESSAEVMAVWKTGEKTAEKRLLIKIVWKSVKIYSFLSGAQGSHLWIWQPSRHFVRVGRSKLW